MESPVPRKGLRKNGPAATAAAFLLLGALHSTALAATGTNSPCATEARDLTSLDVNHDALAVERVDHDSPEPEVDSLAAMEAESAETSTPLLYLTPRVTNLLRDIFRIQKGPAQDSKSMSKSLSPLAGSTDNVETTISGEEVAPLAGAEEEVLPNFQQQMFRKDI